MKIILATSGSRGDVQPMIAICLASVAETRNITYRYIAFTPQLFPSRFHPFPILKTHTLPFFINTMSWKTAEMLDQFNITFLINQYRKKHGLEPVSYAWDHILGKNTIVAAEKEIARMPGDVTQTWIQTGYPHLAPALEQVPALDRFLEKGIKPVYAGFGSMPVKDQIRIAPILIQAARNLGRRIILPRLHGLSTENTPGDDVFFIRDYPHLQLFPKLDAVIHHGGPGTMPF